MTAVQADRVQRDAARAARIRRRGIIAIASRARDAADAAQLFEALGISSRDVAAALRALRSSRKAS